MYIFDTPENDGHESPGNVSTKVGQVIATDQDLYKNGDLSYSVDQNLSYSIVTTDVKHLFKVTQVM
jgi:hypothetical protein